MYEPAHSAAPAPPPARRRSLLRFLAYVWPYSRLIGLATGCGMLKFVLPSTMALSFRFLTDRLVPTPLLTGAVDLSQGGTPQHAAGAEPPSDIIAASFDAYLGWLGHELGPFWSTPAGAFHLLMLNLVLVYAVWAVALYFRSQLAQLAGHRVM